ncbi:MAG TPA: hypothetical protein VGF03_21855, partial [Bryobacteraceae bacterium]
HGGNLRFSEADVERFVREHPEEYALGRVDQEWFKYVVFGHLAEREEVTDVKEKACLVRACGDADTELLKICPGTSQEAAEMRNRVAKLKANWGKDNPPRRVITGGDTLEG